MMQLKIIAEVPEDWLNARYQHATCSLLAMQSDVWAPCTTQDSEALVRNDQPLRDQSNQDCYCLFLPINGRERYVHVKPVVI